MGFVSDFEDVADDWQRPGAEREGGGAGFPATRTEFEEVNAYPHKGKEEEKCLSNPLS